MEFLFGRQARMKGGRKGNEESVRSYIACLFWIWMDEVKSMISLKWLRVDTQECSYRT